MPFTYDPAAPVATTLQALIAYVVAQLDSTPAPTPTPSPTDLDPGAPGATTLSFPADRVSGTNPVVLMTSTLNSAGGDLLQVRYGSSSDLNAIAWVDAMLSAGDEDNEEREFTVSGTLPAGLTYFQARPKRAQDKGGNTIAARYGDPSNVISDTLQAAGAGTPTPTPSDQVVTTLDPATKNTYVTLSNGNLTMTGNSGTGAFMSVKSTSSKGAVAGDFYFEAVCTGANDFIQGIGLAPASAATAGDSFGEIGDNTPGFMWNSDGGPESIRYNNTKPATTPNPPAWGANNDVVGLVARVAISGGIPSYKVFVLNATGDPYAGGAGITVTTTDPLFAAATTKGEDVFTLRFKEADQTYKPPSATAWGA